MTVHLVDIRKKLGRTQALDGVTITLGTGVTGLLGPNGAGKTTLLRILATALRPDSGTTSVFGTEPDTPAGRVAVRRLLGYMPQEPGFHAGFSAFDFIDYVAILKELTGRRERHEAVRRALTEVGLMDERNKRIKALSGGMRRRVALAAAIVGDPRLLVLDEPTVGLDPEQRLRFREVIARLGETRTVLLSTHQTEDVMSLCHQVVVMSGGAVRFDGEPVELTGRAAGRVWLSADQPAGALASWRIAPGSYRCVGDPPPGAELAEPTLEEAYLLLLGGRTGSEQVAA